MYSEPDKLLGGRYRLGSRLGNGGAATVYAAIDVVLGRDVAVKLYRPGSNTMSLYRFGAEARLLASLSHPSLVTLYDVNLEDDHPYLVMQLVGGITLRDLVDREPLDPVTTARHGARLAEALAHVHEHDVVHRDIKPSNVLIDRTGTCYLTDFGIARALSSAHLTASGELIGTAAYLAPEQVTDVDTGPAVDIYALGLVLLECLTGRPEYTGTTVETALARLSRQPRVPDGLAPEWRTLLTAMTAHDPANRPDAARCAEMLHDIAEERTSTTTLLPVPARRSRLSHAGLVMAALAASLVVLTAASTTTVPGQPSGGTPPTESVPADTEGDTETPGETPAQPPGQPDAPPQTAEVPHTPAANVDVPAEVEQVGPARPSAPPPTTRGRDQRPELPPNASTNNSGGNGKGGKPS